MHNNIYDKLHKLPYSIFKNIVCDEDLSLLIISGEASVAELENAWGNILEEYSEAMGQSDMESKIYFNTYRDYLLLKRRQEKRIMYVNLLRDLYVKEWAKRLEELLFTKIDLDPAKEDIYKSELSRYERISSKCIQLSIKEMELIALEKQRQNTGLQTAKPDRKFYARIEQNIEDSAGFAILWDRMSTLEYCERVIRYMQIVEEKKKGKR